LNLDIDTAGLARRPGEIDPLFVTAAGPVATTEPLAVSIAGTEHDLGNAYSYLPSARIEGDLNAEPSSNGTVELMLVPGKNNCAVRSMRQLSTSEVSAIIDRHLAAPALLSCHGLRREHTWAD